MFWINLPNFSICLHLRYDMPRSILLIGPCDRVCCGSSCVIATHGWKHSYTLTHCRKTCQLVHLKLPQTFSTFIATQKSVRPHYSMPWTLIWRLMFQLRFCRLLCHIIGARLQNMRIAVIDRRAVLSLALFAFTNQWVEIDVPLGFGILMGIGSWESF